MMNILPGDAITIDTRDLARDVTGQVLSVTSDEGETIIDLIDARGDLWSCYAEDVIGHLPMRDLKHPAPVLDLVRALTAINAL